MQRNENSDESNSKKSLWQIQINQQMATQERQEMGQLEKLVKRAFIECVLRIQDNIGNVD